MNINLQKDFFRSEKYVTLIWIKNGFWKIGRSILHSWTFFYSGLVKVGIRVVGEGIWKEREVWKFLFKLERAKRSWEKTSEVGKNRMKMEITEWSWKVSSYQLSFPTIGIPGSKYPSVLISSYFLLQARFATSGPFHIGYWFLDHLFGSLRCDLQPWSTRWDRGCVNVSFGLMLFRVRGKNWKPP